MNTFKENKVSQGGPCGLCGKVAWYAVPQYGKPLALFCGKHKEEAEGLMRKSNTLYNDRQYSRFKTALSIRGKQEHRAKVVYNPHGGKTGAHRGFKSGEAMISTHSLHHPNALSRHINKIRRRLKPLQRVRSTED